MFAFLRKLIVPIMAIVLVLFLATIIFQWGMEITSSKSMGKDTVGMVNGEKVSIQTFDQYYSNLLRSEQEKVDYDLPPEKIEEIRRQAWDQLVSELLMQQEIAKRNISVSDDEIYGFLRMYPPSDLQSAPQFMTDGKFDYQKYVNAMVNKQNAPFWASVEQSIVPTLKKYKLQEEIINTVRVTPAEVFDAFRQSKDQVKIGVIVVPGYKAAPNLPPPTADELKNYYDSHKEQFKVGNRATLEMVLFPKEATQNDWDKVGERINEIYDSAKAGADFAQLARDYSEDNSAQNGGDLGWFTRNQMVPEFDTVVWSLQPGRISRPFKTRFGWHIVKLLGKKTEKEAPPGKTAAVDVEKADAAHILLKVSPSQETLDQIKLNASDFAGTAATKGFETTAKDMNYEIKTTTPFGERGFVQFLGQDLAASDFAFNNEVGKISDVMENSSAYYVLKVASHLPEGYTPLDQATSQLTQFINQEKARQKALTMAKSIYDAIKNGSTPQRAAEQYGLQYTETGLINEDANIPGAGRSPEIMGAAFALKTIGEYSQPIPLAAGAAIVRLLEKVSPNVEEFGKIQDSVRTTVLQKKQQDVYQRWFTDLYNNAKIQSNLDKFYSGSY
ncbi:putative PpiC-type peptidyl-prolyl cis-trans isomerase [Candidatus Zixiibacteriota bacterium]|nr:putative PpiC-type peptidyl-prolyl cis-trans isomerase [candidate division Zixibacteria bacterium]